MPRLFVTLALALFFIAPLRAQTRFPDGHLDPTRGIPVSTQTHQYLGENYLWTAGDITAQLPNHNKFPWNRPDLRTAPHYFRTTFNVDSKPAGATLYIAGPRSARVWINGTLAATFTSDIDAPINFHVFHAEVAALLHPGANAVAIEAVRGRGVVAASGSLVTQQIAYGEVLAAKIVPAAFGVEAPALIYSTPAWKSSATLAAGWNQPAFDDHAWPNAATLGPIESNPDFMQWNTDAGMYEWPGYMGMSPNLRTLPLAPQAITHIYEGSAHLSPKQPLTLINFSPQTDSESPAILLDFGREIAGRLLIQSSSSCEATISVAYGESELEALATGLTPEQRGGNYLGTNLLHIPPNGTARGPKSAFRYARIRFLRGCPALIFKSIGAEAIYYPVEYKGSFESSDPVLNRIWETGAYTVHLCMQDGIWDAPKRDRGLWVGDLDVEGRVISTVFGDTAQIENTLNRLAEQTTAGQHVNGIPSYSALWITSLYSLYSHSGDRAFVLSQRDALLRILATMDLGIGPDGVFDNAKHQWLFVDWAPGMYAYTPEAVIGTNLQYVVAYNRAWLLLTVLGDQANADKYSQRSKDLLAATRRRFRDPGTATYGTSWQLNALAIQAFDNDPEDAPIIWSSILSHVKQDAPADQVISPYFNATLLDAMTATGHAQQAIDWLRTYWGGMLPEGATSFWESYDLRWPKTDPHLSLQADGTSGFFVSLAHGWSSGPTAWLSENVLGISEPQNGYKSVVIRPSLLGLDWARGSVPTPGGLIKVDLDKQKGVALDLPPGIEKAFVLLPFEDGKKLYLDGTAVSRNPTPAMLGNPMLTMYLIELTHAGHYQFISR